MSQPLRVAIQGFSAFERSTFEAFFRLSTRRTPAYEFCANLRDSELAIADGDRADTLVELAHAGKLGSTLWIGASQPPGAAQHLRRPINLMAVVKLLDQMLLDAAGGGKPQAPTEPVEPRLTAPEPAPTPARSVAHTFNGPATEPVSPPKPQPPSLSQSQRVLRNLALSTIPTVSVPEPRPLPHSRTSLPVLRVVESTPNQSLVAPTHAPSHAPTTVLDGFPATDIAPIRPESAAEPGQAAMDHILVVDDSDIALRFMANRLERFGFMVHLSCSGEDALVRTEQQHFTFVFMDVNMPGLDGFKTCKTIKRRQAYTGAVPPVIVMLTSRDTPVDKLRGTMAGCDGYLIKPLDETELLRIVGDREVKQHAFAETARAQRED